MANIHGTVQMKIKTVHLDPVHTHKETSVQKHNLNTKVECDEEEWWIRQMIAYFVLYIGFDWL